ncbi:LysR family transcriptional regulator [Marinobacterium rhizophilum]|uniref:LysR family transcriptional regulator n=1 Tax=Marinobacterium rhizophilum TaxID=420402 RepID=UPI00146B133E|nr:LysR family transcriptional regulator [Marinobacterium rhizophilum]
MTAAQDTDTFTPTMRCLRALVAVADTGAVLRAAEALNLSQPAVSRAIHDLEQALDMPLFERHHGGMLSTRAGDIVSHRFRRALTQLTQAQEQLAHLEPAGHFQRLSLRLSYRNLKVLVEIARSGSEMRAARQLGLTQPTVSAGLRDLETKLGVPLFQRTPRGMITTLCGMELIRHVKIAMRELALVQQDLSAWRGKISGRVIIGALPLTSSLLVPQAVDTLLRELPGLSIAIYEGSYDTLFELLRSGEIDMLVGVLRPLDRKENMTQKTLFYDRLSTIVRPDHPLLQRANLSLGELLNADWIAPPQGTPARHSFDQQFHAADLVPPTPVIEAGNLSLLRALLLNSDRIAMVSPCQMRFEIESAQLAQLPVPLEGPPRAIGILMREDSAPTEAIQALCRTLEEASLQLGL